MTKCKAIACTLWVSMCLIAFGAPEVPRLNQLTQLNKGPLVIEAGEEWSCTVRMPEFSPDDVPLLFLRQRLDVPGSGGCNFVLEIRLNDRRIGEQPFRPRLINKAPYFDPPGTDYHFAWHRPAEKAWMTVFSDTFESNWGGTGKDFDSLIDLSGLVTSGQDVTITFRHRMPLMPVWVKRNRAPLLIDPAIIGTLSVKEVAAMRKQTSGANGPRRIEARFTPSEGETPGDPPYELAWANLGKMRTPQIVFTNLQGWFMDVFGEGDSKLEASVQKRLRQTSVAEFSYKTGTDRMTAFIQPPEPLPLPAKFDAANLWLYSDHDRRNELHPQFTAVVLSEDGRELTIDLGEARNSYWQLLHGIAEPEAKTAMRGPFRFKGLIVGNCRSEKERHCYIDSIAFYEQNRHPRQKSTRPRGPTFPIYPDGLLPTQPDEVHVEVNPRPDGADFVAESATGRLVYRWANGIITARWNQRPWFRPIAGAQVVSAKPFSGHVNTFQLKDGVLEAQFGTGSDAVSQKVSLRGRTLVMDWATEMQDVTELEYGAIEDLPEAKPVKVPYLMFNRGSQDIACGRDVFVSIFPDVYHSDFSWVDTTSGMLDDGRLRLIKGTRYDPLTDGSRNPLRERMLITVSPTFSGILPNVPNPPSPNREALAPFGFFMASHPWLNLWKTTQCYGIDHFIVNDFAGLFVVAYPEGFAGRWQPHPALTVRQIQEYRQAVRKLGYKFGMYQDTREFFPLNEWWDEDKVALTSEGDFVEGWYGNLHTKPSHMAEMVRRCGRKVKALYPPECVYLDVHTNLGPAAVDYEVGVPLAGMGRGTILGNGDSIVEARKWYGATVSEGIFRWLYAGLTDMDYAQINAPGGSQSIPLLVDFDLLKLHPLELGTMMGWGPGNYLTKEEVRDLSTSPTLTPNPSFYKYVGTSIAYGHMLLLGYGYVPPLQLFIRYYALMQGIQKVYLLDQVAEILYHDENCFLPTEAALRRGVNADGRLRVRYQGGMTVTVNLNPEETWHVEQAGRNWELPPYGWVIDGPENILAYSALRDGVRVDYVQCPEYIYMGSGEAQRREGAIDVEGAVWLKKQENGWRIIPCGHLGNWERFQAEGWPAHMKDFRRKDGPPNRGCKTLVIDLSQLPGKPTVISGLSEDGKKRPAKTATESDGRIRITPELKTAFYMLQ